MQACRFCQAPLSHEVLDLGMSPLCQKHVHPNQLHKAETFYPLKLMLCSDCGLVQIDELEAPQNIFDENYAYFSSYSDSWLQHCRDYCAMMKSRFHLGDQHFVVEVASNDGYLLQYYQKLGLQVLGVEPTSNTASVAQSKGIETEVLFFGVESARQLREKYRAADVLIGNNVLAHVPDINDFVLGMKHMLADQGIITMEFPHLLQLIEQNQFDTIYHEHYSYLSFGVVRRVFAAHGLRLFDVEELPTHGGSLRIYACHQENEAKENTSNVDEMLAKEWRSGMENKDYYYSFAEKVHRCKRQLLQFLIEQKERGKTIVGYGAPGKGNTLLNYCGIRKDFLEYTVDRNPVKQGNYLPGTHIPIYDPKMIAQTKPDFVLILPWNLKKEISHQLRYIAEWGGQCVVPVPEVMAVPFEESLISQHT